MNNNVFLILAPMEFSMFCYPLEASGLRKTIERFYGKQSVQNPLGLLKVPIIPCGQSQLDLSRGRTRNLRNNTEMWEPGNTPNIQNASFNFKRPLTSNKLRNKGTTEENALVLSREISITRLHLFYMFR